MAKTEIASKTLKYLMGRCVPCYKGNAAKIEVPVHEFDNYIHMFFKKHEYIFAHDPNKRCKTGDMVLIQALPEKLTRIITHKVVDIIFPLGNMVDPVTGKRIAASKYRDDIKEANQLYGESENAFDIDKAPPRGSLEGIRDFTDKPAYKKYYDDPNDPQPYAV